MSKIVGDLTVTGHISGGTMTVPAAAVDNTAVAADAAIARSKLAQDANAEYVIPTALYRIHDDPAVGLPAAATGDDLGTTDGSYAFGTDDPVPQTGDVGAASSTRYGAFDFALPPEYDDGETVTIRIRAGMITAIADGSCTVDVECHKSDEDGTVGSDLCTTAAQNMNSVSFADFDFTITPTSLVSGDRLIVRVAVAYVDTATPVVHGVLAKTSILLDIKG